jgi:hypothetical protein
MPNRPMYDAYDTPEPRSVQLGKFTRLFYFCNRGIDHQRGPDQFARYVLTSVKEL